MDIEEKLKLVNEAASKSLESLIKKYDGADNQERFEAHLLGGMYARMILADMLGYDLTRISEDVVGASGKLGELAQEWEEIDEGTK